MRGDIDQAPAETAPLKIPRHRQFVNVQHAAEDLSAQLTDHASVAVFRDPNRTGRDQGQERLRRSGGFIGDPGEIRQGAEECARRGFDVHQTREAYEEVLSVLLQGLRTGRITHHGKRFRYDDVPVHFEMVQKPHPRFWYAGNLQRAAEQGMNGLGRGAREQVEQYWKIWQAGRARQDPRFLGDDPMVGATRHIVIADTDAEALSLARRAFRAYAEHFHATEVRIAGGVPSFGALPRPGGINADELIEAGLVLAGSSSTVRDKLVHFVDAIGPLHNYLVGAFQWGDLTTEEARRSLDLFATEVKPALSGAA